VKGLAVGRVVHYVAYGTPGGEFPSGKCRAAIVTDVGGHIANAVIDADGTPTTISLCVLNPTGLYFNPSVSYDEGRVDTPRTLTGTPERIYRPGTWHWPEQK
jgi:hypothetical protein